jgi:glycosyltransferase involved in cell wall biosynthesis
VRIGIVAPPWVAVPPPGYGGIEVVVDNLARGLQDAGHDVLLCATGDSTCAVPMWTTLSHAVGTAGSGPAQEACHVMEAYAALLPWEADIVHDHTLVGPIYAERSGQSIVTTNHGPFADELSHYYRRIAPSVPIIAISHHQAATADGIPIAAVIHHGLDVDAIVPGDGRGGFALFLGRMNPAKGVDTAARVAAAAGVPLKIATKLNEPHEWEYFHTAVEPLLGGDVEYLGEVDAEAKHELLSDAFCLLNPIAWPEPFGMVMVESLAHGTPVVAMPHGSVPELIDDGTTGFVRSDEAGLAGAVLAAPELDRNLCREAAVERFSTRRMVEDHLALYRHLLDRDGSHVAA